MGEADSTEKLCLEVVAKVSAAVTHEVNNALAIMNEQAGYLDDLVLMVGDDGELPAERVKRSVSSISSQIGRANNLMKDLNTFAHSGDQPVAAIDLNQLLLTMIRLTGRKAAAAEITVSMQCTDPVIITTKPQLMYGLIFFCLTTLYGKSPAGSTVLCQACLTEGDQEQVELRFRLLDEQANSYVALAECASLTMLLAELEAKLQAERDSVVVQLPLACQT